MQHLWRTPARGCARAAPASQVLLLLALAAGCREALPPPAMPTEALPSTPASAPAPPPDAAACRDCGRQAWRGWYREIQGRRQFEDCRDGVAYPVLPEGDYRALQQAYQRRRPAAEAPLMVQFQAALVQRQASAAQRPAPHILVLQFQHSLPGHDCEGPQSKSPPPPRTELAHRH